MAFYNLRILWFQLSCLGSYRAQGEVANSQFSAPFLLPGQTCNNNNNNNNNNNDHNNISLQAAVKKPQKN